MKGIVLGLLALALAGCSPSARAAEPKPQPAPPPAPSASAPKPTVIDTAAQQALLARLHAMNRLLLGDAQLAQEIARRPEVRSAGEQVAFEQAEVQRQLVEAARSAQLPLVDPVALPLSLREHQDVLAVRAELNDVRARSGAGFDLAFLSAATDVVHRERVLLQELQAHPGSGGLEGLGARLAPHLDACSHALSGATAQARPPHTHLLPQARSHRAPARPMVADQKP